MLIKRSIFLHFAVFTGCVAAPTLVAKALSSRTASRRAIFVLTFLAFLSRTAWALALAFTAALAFDLALAFAAWP